MLRKINSISIINNISKYVYVSTVTISIVITCIMIYVLLGGSLESALKFNINETSLEYSNFDQVPFNYKLIIFLFIELIFFLIVTTLKF